jgi:prepilin-type N-terminal cleavage/methylation domain-containing protein
MTRDIPHKRRRGFTLIELLIVLVIISLLAALAIGVIGAVMVNARTAATSATLSKIQGRMKDRIQTLSELDYDQYEIEARNDSSISITTSEEVKVVAKKRAMREAFPQTWAEFEIEYDDPDLKAEIISKYGTNTFNAATESAEVLYYILTEGPIPGRGRRKVISGVGQVQADEFNSSDTADTDGDGLLEFVDGWGNPLRFYRWPTRLVRPDGAGSTITAAQLANAQVIIPSLTAANAVKDADDPYDAMADSNDPDQFESAYLTPSTYNVPLVISAGEDGVLGLYEPTDTANYGHLGNIANIEALYKNISNLNNSAAGN